VAKRRFTSDTDGGKATSRNSGSSDRYSFSEMRFVRIELTTKEREEFHELLAQDEFDPRFLDLCLAARYNVSINRDKNGGGVLVSIRAEYKDMLDGGLILSGRGKDVFTAVAVCEYKSSYLADENGWLACETRRGGSATDIG